MDFTRSLFRTTLLLTLSLVIAGALWAQPQRMRLSPEERASQLKERLSLDDDQTAKVTEIYAKAQEKISQLMQKAQGDRQAMRGAMLDITRGADEAIEELLTDEQKEEYEKFKEERRQMMQRRRPGM